MTSTSNNSLRIVELGVLDYVEALKIQTDYHARLIKQEVPDALLICEHPAVITYGRGAGNKNIIASSEQLEELKIPAIEVGRGGDVTWHGTGQIVAYPLLDLRKQKQDVAWYLRKLEAVIIALLAQYNISAERICDKTGVWVQDRKIASIGIKLSRWCSMHGFSINYLNCQSSFQLIRACGLPDLQVTSIIEERPELAQQSLTLSAISKRLVSCFLTEFEYTKHEQEKNNR